MARRLSPATTRRVRKELGRQVGPRPQEKPTLKQLGAAFAPEYVLPAEMRHRAAGERIRATAAAVRRVSQQRGVSPQEAGKQLIRVREQIGRRDVALARARAAGKSRVRTLAALRLGGMEPKLLQVHRSRFVTPEGQFEVTAITGKVLEKRRIRPRPIPRRRPVPVATPRR